MLSDKISKWLEKPAPKPEEESYLVTNRRNFLGLIAASAAFAITDNNVATALEHMATDDVIPSDDPLENMVFQAKIDTWRNLGQCTSFGINYPPTWHYIEPLGLIEDRMLLRRNLRYVSPPTITVDYRVDRKEPNLISDIVEKHLDFMPSVSRFDFRIKCVAVVYNMTDAIVTDYQWMIDSFISVDAKILPSTISVERA